MFFSFSLYSLFFTISRFLISSGLACGSRPCKQFMKTGFSLNYLIFFIFIVFSLIIPRVFPLQLGVGFRLILFFFGLRYSFQWSFFVRLNYHDAFLTRIARKRLLSWNRFFFALLCNHFKVTKKNLAEKAFRHSKNNST